MTYRLEIVSDNTVKGVEPGRPVGSVCVNIMNKRSSVLGENSPYDTELLIDKMNINIELLYTR